MEYCTIVGSIRIEIQYASRNSLLKIGYLALAQFRKEFSISN